MLFPPGLSERSKSVTCVPFAISVDAADNPASPEPTTIANLDSLAILTSAMGDVKGVDVRCRQRMDASAMKSEIDTIVKSVFRDIEVEGGRSMVLVSFICR